MINKIQIWWYEMMMEIACQDVEHTERKVKLSLPFSCGQAVSDARLEIATKHAKKANDRLAEIVAILTELKLGTN